MKHFFIYEPIFLSISTDLCLYILIYSDIYLFYISKNILKYLLALLILKCYQIYQIIFLLL